MIRVHGVSKAFGGKTVLTGIDLSLATGQTHVLLGSSGSGKSTLLRMIAGTTRPDAGTVTLEGGGQADQLGYMTQEGGLFPHLTAGDNVTLVARVRRWTRAAMATRLEELGRLVGLDGALLARYPVQLSGGQRQRVALIRALFLEPRYVLLDEPLGALDPIIRRDLQATLKRVFNEVHATVVLVTHDVGEAAFFGDTITLLHEGRVLQHGGFADLVAHPAHAYVTEFLMAQRPVPELRSLLEAGDR